MLVLLRQLLHPAPFRIARPQWPDDLAVLLAYRSALGDAVPAAPSAIASGESDREGPTAGATATSRADVEQRLLVDLGTGLWRLRQRLLDPATGEPREEVRKAYRHFASSWDALQDAGVEVQDHTGHLYDPGHSLKVIAFQPVPELSQDTVVETIRPSIYYGGRRLQVGEVIVGTPVR
jgi:hypothetical protein